MWVWPHCGSHAPAGHCQPTELSVGKVSRQRPEPSSTTRAFHLWALLLPGKWSYMKMSGATQKR